MGVQGVPFFVFDGRLAVSGAQGAPALLEAMRQAA
jgi:predicted DsbA family dithiol-disulfide isomerase